jgi:hypothetical protein
MLRPARPGVTVLPTHSRRDGRTGRRVLSRRDECLRRTPLPSKVCKVAVGGAAPGTVVHLDPRNVTITAPGRLPQRRVGGTGRPVTVREAPSTAYRSAKTEAADVEIAAEGKTAPIKRSTDAAPSSLSTSTSEPRGPRASPAVSSVGRCAAATPHGADRYPCSHPDSDLRERETVWSDAAGRGAGVHRRSTSFTGTVHRWC